MSTKPKGDEAMREALEQAAIDLDFVASVCENALGNESINKLAVVIRTYSERARAALAAASQPAPDLSLEAELLEQSVCVRFNKLPAQEKIGRAHV